jgi:anti-sigma-K factor RskA
MNAINEEPEPQELEALLPWYATGTLRRRDANRVEQALANDGELARRYDLVREELVETIHLNEQLSPPSTRAMERLFAAIDAEEARASRHRPWLDLSRRLSEFLWSLTPRTLARSAIAAAVAILVQAAVIASVVVKEQGSPSGPELASAPNGGSYAVVRFAPQATANDITNFLGAYKAKVVDGPLNIGGPGLPRPPLRDQAAGGRGRQDR